MAGVMDASDGDEHVHLDESTCDIRKIMKIIMKNNKNIELCSLETPKEPDLKLEDFKQDVDFLRSLIGKEDIILTPATKSDCKDLWRWRNSSEIRRCCFDTNPVAWEPHKKWFDAKMKDRNARIYIGRHGRDKVGVIRFDKCADSVSVSVNIDPAFFNRGFGTTMIRLGTEKVFSELGSSKPILAEIKKENLASQRAFKKAGYEYKRKNKRGVVYERSYNR
jgi:RimJ/RimL family protein N-acetyltransferase